MSEENQDIIIDSETNVTTIIEDDPIVDHTSSGTPITKSTKVATLLGLIEYGITGLRELGEIDKIETSKLNIVLTPIENTPSIVSKITDVTVDTAIAAKDVIVDSAYVVKHAGRIVGHGVIDGTIATKDRISKFFSGIGTSIKEAADKGKAPYTPPSPSNKE